MPRAKRYGPKVDGIFGLVLLGVCMGLMMLGSCRPGTKSGASDLALQSGEPIQIAPGESKHRELAGGARDVFAIAVNKDQLLRFLIDKGDLLLSTTLYDPTGVKLLEHVSQDFEIVELSFPSQSAGTYTLELRSQESAPTPRQYELKVEPLTPVTAQNQKDSEARQAMAHGEMLRAQSLAASFTEATNQFDKAALNWSSISDFSNAAQAALKSGDILFGLSEYQEAFKRYQDAQTLAEKADDWLAQARALSQMGRAQSYLGNNDLAQKQLAQAISLFDQHEAVRNAIATIAYGETLTNLAEVSYSLGNFAKSSDHLDSALKVFQNYRRGEARARLLMGQITGSIGKTERAVIELTKAEERYRSISDKNGAALALTTRELANSGYGNERRRIEVFLKAIEAFHSTGDRQSETTALNLLGLTYEEVEQYDFAIDNYQKALQLSQEIGSVDATTATTLQLATAYAKAKKPDQARVYYELCLKSARSAGNARDEINAFNGLAPIYAAQGLHKLAAKLYQKALTFYESTGDLRGQSRALNAYGTFLLQRGEKPKALELYHRALVFSEEADESGIQITTLYNLARAYLELSSPEVALTFIQRSLDLIEYLRTNVQSPEFRASYFSGAQENYALCIHILMQLEKLKPGQGFAAKALAVSEMSRARLLVDLVTQARSSPRVEVATELLKQERKLGGLLRSKAEYRRTLSPNQKAELDEVNNNLAQLRVQYQALLADLSRQQPHLFSLEQVAPIDLQRIQNELRGSDSDTMLLEYSLGENGSYLWAVTSDSLKFYELADRKTIEDATLEYYDLLKARQETEKQNYQARIAEADSLLGEKAAHLGNLVYGPLAGQLGNRRLVIVAEGALQSIPFDALPVPGTNTLLLETNEVDVLPSFSTLIAIRAKQNRSRSTRKLVAVIADPVFSSSDDRVQVNANTSEKSEYNRLTHASEEADAITAAAPWGTTMVAKGFDASRETAMSSDVAQYQIVHFATHAFSDDKQPELSSVVLTMMDRNGEKAEGLMPLHDIYSMDLAAELTVLSACETALGKDTKGEGLVGLTHAFISAGSNTVVASLWKVDDRATAVLWRYFYEALLQQGMSPAAALRSAKLKMMRDKQWNAPYYWAGFVVQGEYENHIAVDHHSSLRIGLILLFLLSLVAAGLLIIRKRKRRFSTPRSN